MIEATSRHSVVCARARAVWDDSFGRVLQGVTIAMESSAVYPPSPGRPWRTWGADPEVRNAMLATLALPLIPRRSPQMALFLRSLTLSLGVLALLALSLASLSAIRSGDSWLDWLWFWGSQAWRWRSRP